MTIHLLDATDPVGMEAWATRRGRLFPDHDPAFNTDEMQAFIGRVGYLEAIYVDPHERGRGCKAAPYRAAREWARNRGCIEFATDSDLSDLEAQRFHRAMGMKETYRIVQFRCDL